MTKLIRFNTAYGCAQVTDDGADLKKPSEIVIELVDLWIDFTYPLAVSASFRYGNPAGFTRLVLFECIKQGYLTIYKDPALYGIWGHGIDDLFLEAAELKDGRVELSIGS